MRARTLLLAVLLAAPAAFALPALVAAGECGGLVRQHDAGSGRDAGDSAAEALAVPREGHFSGFLGPEDAEDWYAADVPGAGQRVMLEAYVPGPAGPVSYFAPALRVSAWRPGATEPSHVGAPSPEGGTNVTFTPDGGGLWLFRIALSAEPPCLAPGASPLAAATTPDDYRFYFGCDPHCLYL